MGGGQSTGQPGNLQAQAEIARLKAELAKATAQVGALSAQLGPANAAAVTTAESHKGAGPIGQRQTQVMGRGAEDTVEQKFARPDGDKARKQRDEVSAEANKGEYVRKEVPKSVAVREMLKAVVVQGMLFENLGDEERNDCVEAFYKVNAAKGETVIQQGDKGVNFYAVAEGSCTITVQHGSGPSVRYGNVGPGNSFGELALLYNTPRAATVKAEVPTELWVLDRATYRAICRHYKSLRAVQYSAFLRKVPQLAGLSSREVAQLAEAMEEEAFSKDEVIIRQGEVGDYFYILVDGEVRVEKDGKEVGLLKSGEYFGEKALLSEDTRAATCVAKSAQVKLLSIARSAFVDMLGALSDLLSRDGPVDEVADLAAAEKTHKYGKDIAFADLDIGRTLGCGAFGRVKLVTHKSTGDNFALKCLTKTEIVKNNLQDHIVNERAVMLALDHPHILKLHNSYKDDTYIYFLLELCLGGELFTFLRKAGRFNEKASRFYAGAVVLAFEKMHGKSIIYRDLKPENLILDHEGFLKVVDFGLAKVCTDRTWTLCGTPDYLAPEIILSKGHDRAVDYWALGVLIYEMSAGFVPFYSDDPVSSRSRTLSHAGPPCCPLLRPPLH
jgi:CRP-like cAMP-binding protein